MQTQIVYCPASGCAAAMGIIERMDCVRWHPHQCPDQAAQAYVAAWRTKGAVLKNNQTVSLSILAIKHAISFAFTSHGAQLIPVCTDEVRTHRLTKSQSDFHLGGNDTCTL